MEGLTDLLPHISGLPWMATFVVIVLTVLSTKGIDALLKLRKSNLEERQYEDGQTKEGYQALIQFLQKQIDELKVDLRAVRTELADSRSHNAKCDADRERLQGQVNVLNEKVARLETHDQNNIDNAKALKGAVKEIDASVAVKLP